MSVGPVSLARRLVLRLLAVFAIAFVSSCALFLVLAWRQPAIEIHDDIGDLAENLAAHAAIGADGRWVFQPDAELSAQLNRPHFAHAVVDVAAGRVLAGSKESIAGLIPEPPGTGVRRMGFVFSPNPGTRAAHVIGFVVQRDGPQGPLRAAVVLHEKRSWPFIAWAAEELRDEVLPIGIPLVIATLLVAAGTIRRTLRPVAQLSHQAGAITPRTTGLRLTERDVPQEVVPLVHAFNAALERLDHGFLVQRRFTANAAHQLRTPLAILRARLDGLPDDGEIRALKHDCERIARVVAQLLAIARLEAQQIAIGEVVDLGQLAASVVAEMAPLAIAGGRTITLDAPSEPVSVRGNSAALQDAVRNLIENALRHGPQGQAVEVAIGPGAWVAVRDRGAGIAESDRARVFEPFWRGANSGGSGTGLGLAIVAEIAAAHDGRASVRNRDGGGAEFRIELPESGPAPQARVAAPPATALTEPVDAR